MDEQIFFQKTVCESLDERYLFFIQPALQSREYFSNDLIKMQPGLTKFALGLVLSIIIIFLKYLIHMTENDLIHLQVSKIKVLIQSSVSL